MARNKFDVDEELQTGFNFSHIKRLIQYVKPYKKEMLITLIIMLIASCVTLLGPYLIMKALDYKIPNKDVKGLILISVIYILTIIVNSVCFSSKIRIMNKVGQGVISKLRSDLFKHIQELPFSYYDSRPHGKIIVRVVNYINSLSDLLSNGIINMITDLFTVIFIVIFMFTINVKLTLISLAGLPLLILAIFAVKTALRKSYQRLSSKLSNLNAYMHESVSGMKVTQSFSRENVNSEIFEELALEYKKSYLSCIKVQNLMGIIVDNISVLVICAVYLVGILKLGKDVSVGTLVAFMGYIGRFWLPITNLANLYNSVVNSAAYVERIFETMDEEPSVKDKKDAIDMPNIKGALEFKDVTFGYEEGMDILKNVNFKVAPGDTIALVGPTGAGKTTITSLISRFYDISGGEISVDGLNIADVKLKSLRKQMGIMLQDSFIFSGSIRDNIRYGNLDASEEEIISAAKTVRAHDFIINLENGYDTVVNERGSRLSAGERQLISFARALLADPKILILDEATSSIDTKTEILLQKGLEKLLKGRTSFIIAHRLSTIKNATKIMYIDGGNIKEAGTHEELMALKGNYYQLYMSQYKVLEAV